MNRHIIGEKNLIFWGALLSAAAGYYYSWCEEYLPVIPSFIGLILLVFVRTNYRSADILSGLLLIIAAVSNGTASILFLSGDRPEACLSAVCTLAPMGCCIKLNSWLKSRHCTDSLLYVLQYICLVCAALALVTIMLQGQPFNITARNFRLWSLITITNGAVQSIRLLISLLFIPSLLEFLFVMKDER